MNRSQLKETLRSPSLTPPSCSTKHPLNPKKKPPVHKTRPNDITNHSKAASKAAKKKSHKSRTNSITPKTLQNHLFHNSNLSDTDISAKYIDSRPNSKINKSLVNRLELTQKVKDLKKNPGPYIDKIIRQSLHKAKQKKISQEKENKEQELEREIRRQEILLQNKQIRMQNSMRFKKKRSNSRTRWESRNGTTSNTVKLRSESSSKVRNYLGSLLPDQETRNKRSVSIGDYYTSGGRVPDPSLLDYIDEKNQKRRKNNEFEKIKKRAADAAKAGRLKNLEDFTRFYHKSPGVDIETSEENLSETSENETNEEGYIIKRNISFIEESDEGKKFQEFESGRHNDIAKYDDLVDEKKAAKVIQRAFRKFLVKKLLRKQRKVQEFCICKQKEIGTCRVKKVVKLRVEKCGSSECEKVEKRRRMRVVTEKHEGIRPLVKEKKNCLVEKSREMTIGISGTPKPSQVPELQQQLCDQISWNGAQLFVIEQLRSFEIASFSEYFSDIPASKHDQILSTINKKYKTVLEFLNNSLESSNLKILESLPLNLCNKISEKKMEKQQNLHQLLENSLSPPTFSLNLQSLPITSEIGVQLSSEMSSDDNSEPTYGISHSRSLSQLHGDLQQGKYTSNNQRDPQKFPIFFDIEDNIEVQSINFIADELTEPNKKSLPSLPNMLNLPMLHLDLMQDEALYSEPRISTNPEFIQDYIKNIFSCVDLNDLTRKIEKPIEKNPLEEMVKLEEKDFGVPSETKIFEFPIVIDLERLLDLESDENELETTLRQIDKADKIHKKMLLHAMNFFLQQFRPYGYEAKPFPWSSKIRSLKFRFSHGEIIKKTLEDFELFSKFQIGRVFNEEIVTSEGGVDEGLIHRLREERMEKMVRFESIQEENEWIDYEFEETQTKFDLSDMILEVLAEEVVNLLSN